VKYFDRDEVVVIDGADGTERATVVLDTGGAAIVITRNNSPSHTKLVARADLSLATAVPPVRVSKSVAAERRSLKCLKTSKGWCAMQIQSRTIPQSELLAGVWTLCDTWVETRDKPTPCDPTCPTCCRLLTDDA
jgi:hypothetical protein